MQTHSLEPRLRDALRETLDRELGPHPVWAGSPAARRVAELQRRRRWPLRMLAVAAVIGAAGGAALLAGAPDKAGPVANGWVAFAVAEEDSAGGPRDVDIWFTAIGEQARRVVGGDTDTVDQACPAFSPDGRSLAYGRVEGIRDGSSLASYRNAALVIADVADDGTVADRLTVDIGDGLPPPCPVWSPTGDQVAFGVPLTSPINPTRSGDGSEVRILRPADGDIVVISDLLAIDLEWSPDGRVLAIVGGVEVASGEGVVDGLQDGRIHLYELSTGTLRALDDTLGATALTWSPDGRRIAFGASGARPASERAVGGRDGLRVIDLATGRQEVLADGYHAIHGIGPVWSPDGETIAYQRSVGGERHEVVLVKPDHQPTEDGTAAEVVMPSERTTTDGSSLQMWPWRVTWSPDGAYLLYVAWTYPTEDAERTVVVAVPTEPSAPVAVLAGVAGIGAYDFADGAMRVPIQVWQRLPGDSR